MRGIATLFSLLLLFGCSGNESRRDMEGDPKKDAPKLSDKAIRISYVRFDKDPRTKKYSHGYRVMMSNSWRDLYGGWYETHGATAREPFRRAFPDPYLNEYVDDRVMEIIFNKMMEKGFDSLPDRDPKTVDLRMMAGLTKERNESRIKAHRILSIERGTYRKTVLFADILTPTFQVRDRNQALSFVHSEIAIINSRAFADAVKVTKGTEPFRPKRKDDKDK